MSTARTRRHRAAGVLGAAVAVLVVTLVAATPAAADGTNWWYDRYGVAEVQAEGWTGAGVRIAVVDAQINPDLPVFQGTPLTVDTTPNCGDVPVVSTEATDDAVHGSDVAALIVGNGTGTGSVRGIAPQAPVTFYGTGRTSGTCDETATSKTPTSIGRAIQRAVAGGARILSISMGMPSLGEGDAQIVADAQAAGVIVVAAMSNTVTVDDNFPAMANGVVAVNALDEAGDVQKDFTDKTTTVIWPETTVVAAGVGFPSVNWQESWTISGSSMATPLVAGMLAVTWQKYPDATANQLIQSLIHNTNLDDHPIRRDVTGGFGYGLASLRHLLAVDPTTYPDENPLLDKTSGVPTLAQIAAAGGATATSTPTPSASATALTPPASDSGASSGIMGGAAIAAIVSIVVVAALVVVIVLIIRRRRSAASEGGTP